MKNLIPFRKEPSMPDFAAFEAAVRTRVPQSRALPAEAIAGVARLGRLVHVLRLRHGWTLRELETRTGLAWLWLALLEHGVLLPSELTEEAVEQLGQAFPTRDNALNPGALFRALAEHVQGLKLSKAHRAEASTLQEQEKVAAAPGAVVREKAAGVARALTAAAEMVQSAIRRPRPIEPWTGLRVALASPTPSTGDIRECAIYDVEELSALRVQPYIRIDVQRESQKPQVNFLLEHVVDPQYPGRYLEPQRGTVEICLIRPAPKDSITVRLGSRNAQDFEDFYAKTLGDYSTGEERQWQAEVTVQPGATWTQS